MATFGTGQEELNDQDSSIAIIKSVADGQREEDGLHKNAVSIIGQSNDIIDTNCISKVQDKHVRLCVY